MPTFARSLRHAARRLLRAPGFALPAILTLTLGIGATTTAFSVVNAVLLRPLPYPEPDQLVSVSHTLVVGGPLRVGQADASILVYQRHNRVFSHFGGYQEGAAAIGPSGGTDAERVPAARVTADLFPALRVAPIRGRVFSRDEDRPGAAPVVVLSERLWSRKYGADPTLVGRTVQVDGVAHEVVGILPGHVRFPASDTEIWLPLRLDPARTESASFDYKAIGRLEAGISPAAAAADLQTLLLRVPDEFPGRLTRPAIQQTRMEVEVTPLATTVIGDVGRLLWLALAAASIILAIACANVMNLFLVRAESRREAMAVLRALGASSAAVVLDFVAEGVIVAGIAGVLGTAFAVLGTRAVQTLGAAVDLPRLTEVDVDATVLAFAAAVVVSLTLFVGGVAALRSLAASAASALVSSARSATASRARHRARNALVVSQVALALILLAGSGLMARTVWKLRAVPTGFEPESALSFRLAFPASQYPRSEDAVRFVVRAIEGIEQRPGIRLAGAISKLPLDELGRTDSAVFVADRPLQPGQLPGIHPVSYASPGYFQAAGVALLEGRSFSPLDPSRPVIPEAIVSRSFAERYWKTESAIGKRLRILLNGPWYTVVGVAENVRDTALDGAWDEMVYCPLLPVAEDPRWTPRDLAFVVRSTGEPGAVVNDVREVVRGLDSSLPVYRIQPLSEIVEHAYARRSFTLLVMLAASAAALLLGAVGLYGVLSYVVTLRTREIGIRLALGALPRDVRRLVASQALSMAIVGVMVGVAGAAVLTRFLSTLLFEVSPTDPTVLAASSALLLSVAAAATWFPARRAARVDPASTLRAD